MKYNPDNINLSKGKQVAKQDYVKGQFAPPDQLEFLVEIFQNGGKVEVIAEGMLDNGASFAHLKVYYIHPFSSPEAQASQ